MFRKALDHIGLGAFFMITEHIYRNMRFLLCDDRVKDIGGEVLCDMSKLTEKQRRFADYYIETGNATESAINAGYSKKTAKQIATENLAKPYLKTYIDEQLNKLADKRIMKAQEALELLTSIGRGEMTEELYIPTEMGIEKILKKPDIKDRQKAIESILKRYPINKNDELKDKKLQAEIEFIQERTKLLQGEKKDTSMLEVLLKTVTEDD